MKCPVCPEINLLMSDRNGIEIDYCPQCRGVWLDRGELDKVIERSLNASTSEPQAPVRNEAPAYRDDRNDRDRHHSHPQHDTRGYNKENYEQKRKKSLLSDLFDF